MRVGDHASIECAIDERDVRDFANLSGDHHPLHMDEAYASKTPFGHRVVHGMLLGAYVSTLVGTRFPDYFLVSESLEFRKPAFIGDYLVITGIVREWSASTGLARLVITITRDDEKVAWGSVQIKAFS
jgi:3-hydroxybutyryl-CoA dehydratase